MGLPRALAASTIAWMSLSLPPLRRLQLVAAALATALSCAEAALETTPLGAPTTAATGPGIEAPPRSQPSRRPRIGLVLSGGGARGISHVGVLKLLERERIPVDLIAGTSMGAIVGGLYASGMTATELESEFLKIAWDGVFASRVARPELSQRRKEEDFDISPVIEIGMRDGELRLPLGALSGRGLESLLRRYTLPVRSVRNFDALPIPFRAVATDMESGQEFVMADGDLALALRSSMSVPGVFAPTEVEGRILGDGGLVNNLPIDVARAMGADIVIAVNIGTPLSKRNSLGSVTGLTSQMINILTEQNVQRSLGTLRASDILLLPQLGPLSSGDFDKTAELIKLGESGAQERIDTLRSLALSPADYLAWRGTHLRGEPPEATLAFIRFEGSTFTQPERLASQLESTTGQAFDPAMAERDARQLAASGDYTRADYLLVTEAGGTGLVFDLEDKPWGPNYFRIGLDLSTDFRSGGGFNIKLSHNRHWLHANGSEWRNQVQIGKVPRWFTEVYHPLKWSAALGDDWFIATSADIERREVDVFNNSDGAKQGQFYLRTARFGVDLGQPWRRLGELRLGVVQTRLLAEPEILSGRYLGPSGVVRAVETGLRVGLVVDQLDYVNFPQRGYRLETELIGGTLRTEALASRLEQSFNRLELQATAAGSAGRHTVNAYVRVQHVDRPLLNGLGRFALGGFHQLSGYKPGQIDGNSLLFGRLTYYRRLAESPVLTRGLFVGGTLEAGNAWSTASQISLGDLRTGMSAFVGADTGLGPLYFGLTYARGGSAGVYLFIGRP